MRIFVAVELSRDTKRRLADVRNRLEKKISGARWVEPSRMHVTLRFVGEVDSEAARRLGALLCDRLSRVAPVRMSVVGIDPFPDRRQPRIVAARIVQEDEGLQALHDVADGVAVGLGAPRSTRPFRPHVTLARLPRAPRALDTVLAPFAKGWLGDETVTAASVFESRLTPRGARYRRLRRCPLAGHQAKNWCNMEL